MTRSYNDPNAVPSTIGKQIRTDAYKRKALSEAMKTQHFQPLADTTAMPKNSGKAIKQYRYIPMLDDRNVSDEGIDASGAIIQNSLVSLVLGSSVLYADDNTEAVAIAAAINALEAGVATVGTGADNDTVIVTKNTLFDLDPTAAQAAIEGDLANTGAYIQPQAGNLYGSSRDIGYIPDRMPTLDEHGGRVNRVGMTRIEIEGTIHKYGFFREYTQESVDFDTDAELEMHVNREMMYGASEITEDLLQLDLLHGVGVTKYSGAATSISTMGADDRVTYGDLVRLGIDLDKNHTPKKTTIITGSRMVDTKVIPAARFMFIGSELLPDLMQLKDFHGEPAFIPVEKYGAAAGATLYTDEAGSIAGFRVIVNHQMMKHLGKGAKASQQDEVSHYTANGRFDVFPMLVVGDGSFTTIGFQAGNTSSPKFTVYHKKPGKETADRNDPFGEKGFMSIKWYYGFMGLFTERLAVQWTVAKL